jgi:thymidylate synthase
LLGGCDRDDATGTGRSSIDFGAKGHGNLVELASPQRHVADTLGLPVGRLLMIVKSAHVHETDLDYIKGVLG